MGEPRNEARSRDAEIVRSDRGGEIAHQYDRGEQQEQVALLHARCRNGKDRRADNDAERIGADEIACLWDGDAGRLRHAGQKSNGGELAGSDKEATQTERDLRERHALRGGDNLVLYHDPCLSRAARITDQACPGFARLKPPRVPWRVTGWR